MSAPMTPFSATVSGHINARVLVLTIDNPPVNALSSSVRAGLAEAIRFASVDPAIDGIVLASTGKVFIGGADITEFGKPPVEPILPDVIAMIESSDKPVIAAIQGAALGGGFEVALGCHYRIASPKASFAFTEVKLGLVPGAGGTQRLPRVTGLAVALDMIGTGRSARSAEALAAGMIDRIDDDPVAAATAMIDNGDTSGFRRTGTLAVHSENPDVLDPIAKRIAGRSRGQPAPAQAIRLVRASADVDFAAGLADERQTFIHLRDSDEAAALRHVFFAEREAAKVEGMADISPRPVATVGIVGLGLMGAGIAVAALDAGLRVIGIEQTEDAAEKGGVRIEQLLERNRASGRIDATGLSERMGRLLVTSEMSALARADLAIEAVFDDLAVKTALFSKLAGIVRPDCILATNTSYLDPDTIAASASHPERVLGLHFFSPANVMRLLEVVRCSKTADDVLATGLAFAKKLGKLPVVCGVAEGFVGNSIFSAYRNEAEFLLEDGASPEEIDKAMEAYGFAMGPFAVFDMAGLEIAWARRKRQAATRNPSERYVDIPDRICEAGRLGRKSGRGWYAYPDGKATVDDEVTAIIAAARAAKNIVPRAVPPQEIVERLLAAMAAQGERLLAAGVASRSSDIDLVMINGYGFPAHKGGPMYAAHTNAAKPTYKSYSNRHASGSIVLSD